MVKRIQQLPPIVANQIAAGEVIERPASVVKELCENALDSGADNIQIEIQGGGLIFIRVSDNGSGILADDLPLAIAAHATSKISCLEDLFTINSMGFRGEALASISSVSHLKIISKPEEQEHGMMLQRQGDTYAITPFARSTGTTIEVRDLFYNAPVRKKFLKSENIEFQAIETVVKRFALSATHISIVLKHNNKEVLVVNAADSSAAELIRIKKVLGKSFIEQAGFIEIERAGMCLRGWVSGESYQRSQNDKQWIYINNRMVKDKLLHHAIKQGYEGVLHPGKHPACLLFLTIAPKEVDINVHPTKHEVRFQDPRLVHDFISSQIAKVLHYSSPLQEEKKEQFTFLQESYIAKPLKKNNITIDHAEFIVINSEFVLFFLNHETPLLIRFKELFKNYISHQLQDKSILQPRSLLVPIRYKLQRNIQEMHFKQLQTIGIELQLVSEKELVIRSAPQGLPYLKIQDFLCSYFQKMYSAEELLKLLSLHQELTIEQLSETEKGQLIQYINESYRSASWGVVLNKEICLTLFKEQQAYA